MYTPNMDKILSAHTDEKPTTYDFLKPNAFLFNIKELPLVSYNCQNVALPDVGFGSATQPTPFHDVPITGEKLRFGDLSIQFIVSENMENYIELLKWLYGIGAPHSYQERIDFNQNRSRMQTQTDSKKLEQLQYSDGTLTLTSAANLPLISVKFKNLFPVMLSGFQLRSTIESLDYVTCSATFKYSSFEVESVK